jgi:ABC-type transport system substrate-binding protein
MMPVFNNLVMFKQDVPQNSLRSIVPDLVTSWSWNEEGTELTLPLRQGVKWHDSQPFTAKDVKCTWDLLTGKGSEKLRINPHTIRMPRSADLLWSAESRLVGVRGSTVMAFVVRYPNAR